MIKYPEKYKRESERERRKTLRKLTLKESADIMEFLLDSELIDSLNFTSHLPVCAKIGLKSSIKGRKK